MREGFSREIMSIVRPDEHVDGGVDVSVFSQLTTFPCVLEHLTYLIAPRLDYALAKE